MLFNKFAEAQTFVQLARQNQTAVRGDPRSLESNPQKLVERQLPRLFLALTRWVYTSGRQ
ncbi:MAG: hypothetical protein A3F68_01420 [Acidobacteria bacterium RIFCSPLOWO2_12_FULL_54_10]|nr:MAG: hypothetical protein A3F68_01420 [Acidobacteria bacterium RIFCSPLOWO2_12_FULL_54_10]